MELVSLASPTLRGWSKLSHPSGPAYPGNRPSHSLCPLAHARAREAEPYPNATQIRPRTRSIAMVISTVVNATWMVIGAYPSLT